MTSTRDKIFATVDLPTELLEVPRWDTTIAVRGMPIANSRYTRFVEAPIDKKGTPPGAREVTVRRHIGAVILCALDADTLEPLFRWSDADQLREKHWNTVLDIATKAYELAGNPDDDDDDGGVAESDIEAGKGFSDNTDD